MATIPLENDKYPLDEETVQDVLSDEDYRKLDRRVTRKIDIHILPWIIVCEWDRTLCGTIADHTAYLLCVSLYPQKAHS